MSTTAPGDPTFQRYNKSQALSYAAGRPDYPDDLVSTVLDVHRRSGGNFSTLVDIGCGPGIAARQLGVHFARAYGLDPSPSMIEAARELGGKTECGESIVFDVSGAEEMDAKLATLVVHEGEVDLITAATAAHWFELPKFYQAAARMLRPGGSLIMFCLGGSFVDSTRTANAVELQRVLDHFERVFLQDYGLKGNALCGGLYTELPLPWSDGSYDNDNGPWNQNETMRLTWDQEHNGLDPDHPSSLPREYTIDQLRQAIGTASSVTRWRDHHREELEAGKVTDCVDDLMFQVQDILQSGESKGLSTDIIAVRLRAGLIRIRKKVRAD